MSQEAGGNCGTNSLTTSTPHQILLRVTYKGTEIGGACGTNGEWIKFIQAFG